jgi:hypothetical protein
MRLVTGAWAARLVHTAVELGIADHLADGPRSVEFLAAQIGAHAPSLARLLRALTAIGVLHESEERLYSLTPLGVTLRSNVPGSMRAWVLLAFSDDQGTAWQALSHAVRTGELAFRHIFGTDIWTRLAERPEAARILPEQIDPDDALTRAKFIHDINMMVNPGGRERNEAEFRSLLSQAGLRLACVLALPGPLAVMEVDPI